MENMNKYAIIGHGGIRIVFYQGLYEPSAAENLAIRRARALGCSLFLRNFDGEMFQIYPIRRKIERRAKIYEGVYPEMMTHSQYQVGASSLSSSL